MSITMKNPPYLVRNFGELINLVVDCSIPESLAHKIIGDSKLIPDPTSPYNFVFPVKISVEDGNFSYENVLSGVNG
jgi:hypothetical protein